MTFTTVGYGDIVPVTSQRKFLAICTALLGATHGFTFVAIILQALNQPAPKREKVRLTCPTNVYFDSSVNQVELAAVLRAQARRTTVPGPAFQPDAVDAALGLQCVDREAAIACTAAPA
jgi:hypothetical protein